LFPFSLAIIAHLPLNYGIALFLLFFLLPFLFEKKGLDFVVLIKRGKMGNQNAISPICHPLFILSLFPYGNHQEFACLYTVASYVVIQKSRYTLIFSMGNVRQVPFLTLHPQYVSQTTNHVLTVAKSPFNASKDEGFSQFLTTSLPLPHKSLPTIRCQSSFGSVFLMWDFEGNTMVVVVDGKSGLEKVMKWRTNTFGTTTIHFM